MQINKRIFICLLFFTCSYFLYANNLLYDITDGNFRAQSLESMYSCVDGENYLQIIDNKAIVKYNIKTGNVVDTIFNVTNTKLHRIKSINGFVLDPTENRLLVYNNVTQIYRRSFSADYFLFDIKRNELKVLSDTMPIQNPCFSPNGKYIAFARNNDLWIHKVDFGTEEAITRDGAKNKIINGIVDWLYEEEFSITSLYSWSPDSKLLAFVRFDESEVPTFAFQTFLNKEEPNKFDLYPNLEEFKYPKAGEVNPKVSVCVYDSYYKSIKTMQIGDEGKDIYVPRIKWTNSSEQLAIFKFNRNQTQLEMLIANPKSTICKSIYNENADVFVDFEQIDELQFLTNNSFIAVNETDGYRHVYLYSPVGTKLKQLTKGEFDVTKVYGYDEKTQMLYYQSAELSPMRRNIYALDTKRNRKVCIASEEGTHNAIFFAGYRYFIDAFSSINAANRYTLKSNTGQSLRLLKENNEVQIAFEELNLPQKEFFSFKTEAGHSLNGWIVKPANFDPNKQYPMLQVQYSGPNSQQVLDRWKIDWEYYLATKGYVVVCVDGRGTGARGREFRSCTYLQLGKLEAEDQIATAKYFGAQPYIDANRIGIWGWSYGGFMTLVCMSQPEQVFKAGISIAPVTDYKLYDSAYTERYMRRPQENFRGYEETSPMQMAENLKGNLLIVHGTADDNVHVQNTFAYTQRLVEANKQFEMQIYTDDNHFLRKGNNYKHLYTRMVNFLDKNL